MPHVVNPIIYVIPIIVFFIVYYLYCALNRSGLDSTSAVANVTEKKYVPEETKMNNMDQYRIVPEYYRVKLDIGGELAKAFVTKELYQSLNVNDVVHVIIQRTRISRKLLVVEITR